MELIQRHLTEKQLRQIVNKCWENEKFKQALVNNPISTINSELGLILNIPEGVQLVVNDQSDSKFMYLNIPPQIDFEDVELTDAELDFVSGGTGGSDPYGG